MKSQKERQIHSKYERYKDTRNYENKRTREIRPK